MRGRSRGKVGVPSGTPRSLRRAGDSTGRGWPRVAADLWPPAADAGHSRGEHGAAAGHRRDLAGAEAEEEAAAEEVRRARTAHVLHPAALPLRPGHLHRLRQLPEQPRSATGAPRGRWPHWIPLRSLFGQQQRSQRQWNAAIRWVAVNLYPFFLLLWLWWIKIHSRGTAEPSWAQRKSPVPLISSSPVRFSSVISLHLQIFLCKSKHVCMVHCWFQPWC